MGILNRNETALWLAQRDNFCILTHRRPDGDTVGSAAALCLGLQALGKTAVVLENPDMTPKFSPFLDNLTCPTVPEGAVLVCVDLASPNLLPKEQQHLVGSIALRIDHHATATSFTEEELVDAHAGACGEIIYDVLMTLGLSMTPRMGEALYVAVSTDTGCFRYANTTAHTFAVASACAASGADLFAVNQIMFETHRLEKLRLQGWIVEHTHFLAQGRLAVCPIPGAVAEGFGVNEDDMDNISSFPRSIAGVRMSATLRQTKDGLTKVSVRAVPGYDAGAVCAKFGGGGHKGAAGAVLRLSLEEATAALEAALLEAEENR